jgi:signal transduction histidine kinase
VEIIVSDTGRGISPDVLPFIFERFRQADSSSTRAHMGLGLGLALVKHLVELHGGSVVAESGGDGKGATFIVKLPVSVAQIPIEAERRLHPTATPAALVAGAVRLDGLV